MDNQNNTFPLISIIIPVYNSYKTISRCLDSIINQTYKNWEAIVIDDGSDDSSSQICCEYALRDSRIIIVKKLNGGPSSARNFGLKSSKGEYIGFCDSDDWADSNMLEEMYKGIRENHCQISLMKWNESFISDEQYYSVLSPQNALKKLLEDQAVGGYSCTKLIKKTCIDNIFFDEKIYFREDNLFTAEVFSNSSNLCLINNCFYHYSQNENSIVHSASNRHLTTLVSMKKIRGIIEKQYPDLLNDANCLVVRVGLELIRNLWYKNNLNEINYHYIKNEIHDFLWQKKVFGKLSVKNKITAILSFFDIRVFSLCMKIFMMIK